jgi:hypothetical protein
MASPTPLLKFLADLDKDYSLNLQPKDIDRAYQHIKLQGISTVDALLQPNVIDCLPVIVESTPLHDAIMLFYTKRNSARLRPALAAPSTPASSQPSSTHWGTSVTTTPSSTAPSPPPGLSSPPGLVQQKQPTVQTTSQHSATLTKRGLQTTPSTTSAAAAAAAAIATTAIKNSVITFIQKPQPSTIYLAGKHRRQTTCRFCSTQVIIGINDYSTLLARTTQIYNLLQHQAEIIQSSRSQQSNHVQQGLHHRQPQLPYILDINHPLPLPLPVHLTDVCDGGQLLQLERRLFAQIVMLSPKNANQDQLHAQYTEKDTGLVDLTLAANLLLKSTTQSVLRLFENPPYQVAPIPVREFLQSSPSGESPIPLLAQIPECIQRMAQVCTRILPCGCPCQGLRGELPVDCPPCAHHEVDENEMACFAGEECTLCTEPVMKTGPMFISGTYQHIGPKLPRGKTPDIPLPAHDYLFQLGLNGNYVNYSKTSPNPLVDFEIDNHNPYNFQKNDGKLVSTDQLDQPTSGQTVVARQTWDHEELPPLLPFLDGRQVCKHSHHLLCFMDLLNSNWGQSKRIDFGYLRCPLCRLYIFHPLLAPQLVEHYAMEQFVIGRAVQHLEAEGGLLSEEIKSPKSEWYNNPIDFALHRFVFYLCSICQKPYCGGAAECQMDDLDNQNSAPLVCLSCSPTLGKQCEHDEDSMIHKCKFCCSQSTYVCWSNTWFCTNCHNPSLWPKLVSSRSGKNKLEIEQYDQCISIKRQIEALQATEQFQKNVSSREETLRSLRCDPKECPLRVAHPPNGFNYVIGCQKCESEGKQTMFCASDDEPEVQQEERIVLQGVKKKRDKIGRIKRKRVKAIPPPPSPYIVPFFEMERKSFQQLSLYSYLFLFRVLYDIHFVMPQASAHQAYLEHNQVQAAKLSPLIQNFLDASGLRDKVKFIDVLPLTVESSTLQRPPIASKDSIQSNRITLNFVPSYPLDHNGFLYFLGTMAQTQPYLNPYKRGFVDCVGTEGVGQADEFTTLPPWGFIERGDVRHVSDNSSTNPPSYTVDFKSVRIEPTHYSLKHYITNSDGCIRSWILEGCSNGSWYTLDKREHDYSLSGTSSVAIFACNRLANARSFSQFRVKQTGPNSRQGHFLACNGFEIYGRVQMPTLQELLGPAAKLYSETTKSDFKFANAPTNPCTTTPLIPNCLRFVLDNGVRYINLVKTVQPTLSILLQEETFRFSRTQEGKKTKRAFGLTSTNFLPIQLPSQPGKGEQQALILTRNFSLATGTNNGTNNGTNTHNNRLDLTFLISYNEPILCSIITALNCLFQGTPPQALDDAGPATLLLSPASPGNTQPQLYDSDTYLSNVGNRSQWQLFKQFLGPIVPHIDFLNEHYNLPADKFQQSLETDYYSHLKSRVELDNVTQQERQYQATIDFVQSEAKAEEEKIEELTKQQRRHRSEEEKRIADMHLEQQQQQQQQQQHPQPLPHRSPAVKPQAALATTKPNILPLTPAVITPAPNPTPATTTKTATTTKPAAPAYGSNGILIPVPSSQPGPNPTRLDNFIPLPGMTLTLKPQNELNKPAEEIIRTASFMTPIPIHQTPPQNDVFSHIVGQSELLSPLSGGLLYYLGTLNHTDITNNGSSNATTQFNFTNPAKLGAVWVTGSNYGYKSLPIFHIVDLCSAKTQPSHLIEVSPDHNISCSQKISDELSDSPTVAAMKNAWIQFDFGSYRAHITGYLMNFKGVSAQDILRNFIVEGSNGIKPSPAHDSQMFLSEQWIWNTICTHSDDKTVQSEQEYYNVDFSNPNSGFTPSFDSKFAFSSSDHYNNNYIINQHAYRFIRIRATKSSAPIKLNSIDFFGTLFATIPFQTPGKTHYDLVHGLNKSNVYNDPIVKSQVQAHAKISSFFRTCLVRHSLPHVSDPSAYGAYGPGFNPNECVSLPTHRDDGSPLIHNGIPVMTYLPKQCASIFEYARLKPGDSHYSSYSTGVPGVDVWTFGSGFQYPTLFTYLNQAADRYSRGFLLKNTNLSSGNILKQLEHLFAAFSRLVGGKKTHSAQAIRTLLSCLPSQLTTATHIDISPIARMYTAVYTSSTHLAPILTTQQGTCALTTAPILNIQPPTQLTHTQFALPTILTQPLPNRTNNIAWASSPENINPYVIIDLGQYQRLQLTGYYLSVFAGNEDNIAYPRDFQLFGSLNGKTWYIISAHVNDASISRETPVGTWSTRLQTIGSPANLSEGIVDIPVQDTMTPCGVPLYFPAYRFFCFIGTGVNSLRRSHQLILSGIDLTGVLISSVSPLSTLPFPYDPASYSSFIPPTPL